MIVLGEDTKGEEIVVMAIPRPPVAIDATPGTIDFEYGSFRLRI